MNIEKLIKNLIDMVMEQQAKLGFLPETVRLYYPLDSVNALLGTDYTADEMQAKLERRYPLPWEGGLTVTHVKDRFCFTLPPAMSAYVHELSEAPDNLEYRFIKDFVALISGHGTTIGQIKALFESYAGEGQVCACKMENEDFDYLFFFADGVPDSYRYCITDEGVHLIYHRYTPEDYARLGIEGVSSSAISREELLELLG